jgi:LacI family transcriptional regulator
MDRRPTIIDVAKHAGVSKSTVSRVIADGGSGVSEDTRHRVETAIRELGYVQNAVASSLRTDRTNIIMLAIPDITNPYWPEVARGVQDVMDQEKYAVVFANSDWDETRERDYLEMARQNRFDAILINPVKVSPGDLAATGIPTVLLGVRDEFTNFDMVGADTYSGTMQALNHLFELGHTKIGIILGVAASRAKDQRYTAFQDFYESHRWQMQPDYIQKVSFTRKGGAEGLNNLLALKEPPSAVFCANDIIAIGALQAARQSNLNVPEELSIIGLDDIFAATTTTPPLTTVEKPKYEIGRQAALFLLDHINKRQIAMPRKLLLRGQLKVRATTAVHKP